MECDNERKRIKKQFSERYQKIMRQYYRAGMREHYSFCDYLEIKERMLLAARTDRPDAIGYGMAEEIFGEIEKRAEIRIKEFKERVEESRRKSEESFDTE